MISLGATAFAMVYGLFGLGFTFEIRRITPYVETLLCKQRRVMSKAKLWLCHLANHRAVGVAVGVGREEGIDGENDATLRIQRTSNEREPSEL